MNQFRKEQLLELLGEPEIQEKIRALLISGENVATEVSMEKSPEESVDCFPLPDGRKGFGEPVTSKQDWEGMYRHLQEEYQGLLTRNTRLEQELTQALRQSKTRLTEVGKLKGELAQAQELMDIREGQMVDLSNMLEEAQATLLVYASHVLGEDTGENGAGLKKLS